MSAPRERATERKPAKQGEICAECKKKLSNESALLDHWEKMYQAGRGHFHCAMCTRLFKSLPVWYRHKLEVHPERQSLKCPGCDKMFTRAGAVIAHIESDKCSGLSNAEWDESRELKLAFARELSLRNEGIEFKPEGSVAGSSNSEQVVDFSPYLSKAADTIAISNLSKYRFTPAYSTRPDPVSFIYKEFPRLPLLEYRHGNAPDLLTGAEGDSIEQKAGNKWAEKNALFPVAQPAVRTAAAEKAQALTERPKLDDHGYDRLDPRHPSFDARQYYVPVTKKFRCPHKLCGSTFTSSKGLSTHLLSPAHARNQMQCPTCLRWFNTHAALVQHAEAPGAVRCTVTASNNYRHFVDQLTSGLMDTEHRHADGTAKFTVPESAYEKFNRQEQSKKAQSSSESGSRRK